MRAAWNFMLSNTLARVQKKGPADMTTLVTGGAGYIGSHMSHALIDAGEEVVVLDNFTTGERANVPNDAQIVEGCVGDAAFVADVLERYGVEDVLHFAGSTVVPESVADPLKYYRNNVANLLVLLEAMQTHEVERLIFSSTAAVYRQTEGVPISEEAELAPASPYGATKLAAEQMIASLVTTGAIRAGVLRYFNVAGADPHGRTGQSTPNATHLIKVACEAACGLRGGVTVYGTDWPTEDGTGVRDYIHVTDLVSAHLLMLEHLRDGRPSLTLNCGYGEGFSVRDVIDAVERVGQVSLRVEEGERRPGDLPSVVADSRRLADVLDWRPAHADLDEIVRHALWWERSRVDCRKAS